VYDFIFFDKLESNHVFNSLYLILSIHFIVMASKNNLKEQTFNALKQWQEREKKAIELLKIAMDLRLEKSVDIVLFRKAIFDTRPSKIIHNHTFGKHYSDKEITVDLSLKLAKAIMKLEKLAPMKIDVGHLGMHWLDESDKYDSLEEFVKMRLTDYLGVEKKNKKPKDIILFGFGRIGRIVAREIIGQTGAGDQLLLKAIVIRPKLADKKEELIKRANLFRSDSVHGDFQGDIRIKEEGDGLVINGNHVLVIYANSPEELDYTQYGIEDAMVIDNTGVYRDKKALSIHMRPGVSQVLLSAPSKDIPNIVFGVNHNSIDLENDKIFSAASCTTNAIVPVIKVLNDEFGIVKGHVESIHSYTNDQNLLDNFHKKPRRGKAAANNMVITSTGAASAVEKVIPELKGILTGNAVRVPTPNVSLAILNLTLKRATTFNNVNNLLYSASLHGDLIDQIHYSDSDEYASTDAIGMITTSVYDAPSTKVSMDGKNITIYLWYDNEWGYSVQLVRFAKYASQVARYRY
jgi:glyceraldehyde 3-phosphate dehydrogenase